MTPSPVQALPRQRFQLSQMIGAGEDGASYLGRDGEGPVVLVHRLKKSAVERVRRRLELRRLAEGARFVDVVHADLELDEPLLVTERISGTLEHLLGQKPLERDVALKVALSLARALADAHRVGAVHGQLSPHTVWLREDITVALELVSPMTGLTPEDPRCRAPESAVTAASDLFALGVMLGLMTGGSGAPVSPDETATGVHGAPRDDLKQLAKDLVDAEPSWRPSADDVLSRLEALDASARATDADAPTQNVTGEPTRLGRFQVEELIGKGAMGRVYRAVDLADGTKVALKLLDTATQGSLTSLRRFRKEARLLAEVKSPYISNLIEMNRDQGQYFMAVELVEGKDLSAQLKEKGPFDEAEAVAIAADVARALAEVHARGIIHRDIKPANIIMLAETAGASGRGANASLSFPRQRREGARVKLIDFGIARHVDESASLQLTEAGASIGTPVYMSPEQCKGGALDGKSDVYALGVTLFALVAGKPPFSGSDSPEAIFTRHLFETAPLLHDVAPKASRELSALLARCLEKDPKARPDAATLLHELEHLQGEDVTRIDAHPRSPAKVETVVYRFEWDLKAGPDALWAYVSNTDRINRAIGLGPVEQSFQVIEGEVFKKGQSPSWPFTLKWREHPFEWVHGLRLGVLRELEEGPLRWYKSSVDLQPLDSGGTHLVHTIELEPRGVMGRAAAAVEIGMRTRLALSRVYQRIDELASKAADQASVLADAYEAPHALEPEQEERLKNIERRMMASGADLVATARLGDFLRHAPAQEVARIRPLALAKKLNLDTEQLTVTCLWGAREGSLQLQWDLVCPTCRVPSEVKDTLRAVKEHGRCEVCNVDYALDLASSVELVFSAHPQIRPAEKRLYCLGSPGHAPHVLAQVRIKAGERFELPMRLAEGRYQLVGRHLPFKLDFRVRERAGATRWEIQLAKGMRTDSGRMMTAGNQLLVLENDTDREQLVRIERTKGREDALTAAKVAAQPLFRKLFPTEVLAPGQLVNVSNVALLMVEVTTDLDKHATDSGSFAGRYALFRRLEEKAGAEGGSVVKIAGEGVVAVFSDVAGAVRAALSFGDDPLPLRVAVHTGPAAAVSLDEHIDYFGRTVREASKLLTCGAARELVLSEVAAADPAVLPLIAPRAAKGRVDVTLGAPVQRVPLVLE
ncbi:MAG: protein kinase [Myxococcaceae bacterium]|nr:protein kinase [Myxococcaceae bacterium]